MVKKTMVDKLLEFKLPKSSMNYRYSVGNVGYALCAFYGVRLIGNENEFDVLKTDEYGENFIRRANALFDIFFDSQIMEKEEVTKKELTEQLKIVNQRIREKSLITSVLIEEETYHKADYNFVKPILSLLNGRDKITVYYPKQDKNGILVIEQNNIKFICACIIFK